MFTNFDDVVCDEHDAVQLLTLGYVERCTATLLGSPAAVDERVTHDDIVLIVAWIDVQRRVARAVTRAHAQIH